MAHPSLAQRQMIEQILLEQKRAKKKPLGDTKSHAVSSAAKLAARRDFAPEVLRQVLTDGGVVLPTAEEDPRMASPHGIMLFAMEQGEDSKAAQLMNDVRTKFYGQFKYDSLADLLPRNDPYAKAYRERLNAESDSPDVLALWSELSR